MYHSYVSFLWSVPICSIFRIFCWNTRNESRGQVMSQLWQTVSWVRWELTPYRVGTSWDWLNRPKMDGVMMCHMFSKKSHDRLDFMPRPWLHEILRSKNPRFVPAKEIRASVHRYETPKRVSACFFLSKQKPWRGFHARLGCLLVVLLTDMVAIPRQNITCTGKSFISTTKKYIYVLTNQYKFILYIISP